MGMPDGSVMRSSVGPAAARTPNQIGPAAHFRRTYEGSGFREPSSVRSREKRRFGDPSLRPVSRYFTRWDSRSMLAARIPAVTRGRSENQRSGKGGQLDHSCASFGTVQAPVTGGRSRRLVQRLELFDQGPHVLAQLYLSEEDADRTVLVDEEVSPQSAGPANAATLRSLCLYRRAETPTRPVPEPGEEAVRGLARRRHLVTGHLPQVIG